MSEPVIRPPDWSVPFVVQCDASDVGISAILSQHRATDEYVCEYASRRLTEREKKWPVHEREALAVVFGLDKFRHYLMHAPFVVHTDNAAVSYVKKSKKPGKLSRWAMAMAEFDFEVVHRPGKANANADYFSRVFVTSVSAQHNSMGNHEEPNSETLQQQVQPAVLFLNENMGVVARAQRKDPEMANMIEFLLPDGNLPPQEAAKVRRYVRFYTMIDGLLFHIHTDGDNAWNQLMVPKQFRQQVLKLCHSSEMAGHGGVYKTYMVVRSRFFWKGVYKDCKNFVKGCLRCRLAKTSRPRRDGLFQQPHYIGPFVSVHIDLVGPLTKTKRGDAYIISDICPFNGYEELHPMENIKATTVAQAFWDCFITRHSIPRYVHSDRGAQFMSALFRSLNQRLGTFQTFTTAYHPQGNGRCERTHRRLGALLKIFAEEPRQWDVHLQSVAFAIRTAVADGHEHSPFEYVYGRKPTLPIDIHFNAAPAHLPQDIEDFHHKHLDRLQELQALLRATVQQQREKRQPAADARRRHIEYKIGATVLVFTPTSVPGVASKLCNQWHGPQRITRKLSDVNYEVQDQKG